MSIPSLKSMGGSMNSMTGVGLSSGNSQTLERPKQQVSNVPLLNLLLTA